jgi:hypothetical protein
MSQSDSRLSGERSFSSSAAGTHGALDFEAGSGRGPTSISAGGPSGRAGTRFRPVVPQVVAITLNVTPVARHVGLVMVQIGLVAANVRLVAIDVSPILLDVFPVVSDVLLITADIGSIGPDVFAVLLDVLAVLSGVLRIQLFVPQVFLDVLPIAGDVLSIIPHVRAVAGDIFAVVAEVLSIAVQIGPVTIQVRAIIPHVFSISLEVAPVAVEVAVVAANVAIDALPAVGRRTVVVLSTQVADEKSKNDQSDSNTWLHSTPLRKCCAASQPGLHGRATRESYSHCRDLWDGQLDYISVSKAAWQACHLAPSPPIPIQTVESSQWRVALCYIARTLNFSSRRSTLQCPG